MSVSVPHLRERGPLAPSPRARPFFFSSQREVAVLSYFFFLAKRVGEIALSPSPFLFPPSRPEQRSVARVRVCGPDN